MHPAKPPQLVRNASQLGDVDKVDLSEPAFIELFFIEHPVSQKRDPAAIAAARQFASSQRDNTLWIEYAERNLAICVPTEDLFFKIRTARNRNVISEDEQQKYRRARIGIAGLSVGSAALAAIVATGGPKEIKLADPDTVELTNLNRMEATMIDIGSNKTDVAARRTWLLDPFADLELWREGVSMDTLRKFLAEPRIDVYVDEMDDIRAKFEGRKIARELHIPVVMATDNGDGAILDVERFDLEPDRPIFHGRVEEPHGSETIDRSRFIELANAIIDTALFTDRQYASVKEVGATISGVPQLGTAARIAGAAVAFAVRMITTGRELPSGRYVIAPEKSILAPVPTNA